MSYVDPENRTPTRYEPFRNERLFLFANSKTIYIFARVPTGGRDIRKILSWF